jgi:hypothetical protein
LDQTRVPKGLAAGSFPRKAFCMRKSHVRVPIWFNRTRPIRFSDDGERRDFFTDSSKKIASGRKKLLYLA